MTSRTEQKRQPDPLSTEGSVDGSRRVIKGVSVPLDDIVGTPNQVIVTPDGTSIVLSTPQDIDENADVTFDTLSIDKIIFNLLPGLIPAEGELVWDEDSGTLSLGMPGGNVVLQIGLEALVRVVNKSGVEIPNGKLVYVSGSQGQTDTIELSDSTDVDTIFLLGMTTEAIGNNNTGYVARFGYVRGSITEPINTTGMVEGDKLYLSTLGDWVTNHPSSATEAVVLIGTVNRVHSTNGVISLQPAKTFTIGNDFNGTIRQSVVNKNTGTSAASGFTATNDNGHFTTMGIAGSGNLLFPGEVSINYAPGYGDHWQAVDGNKDFVWFTDPTDSHDNSSLLNEIMRLFAAGHLALVKDNSKMLFGGGNDFSLFYDGIDAWIKTDEVDPSDLKVECGTEKTIELQTVVWDDDKFPASGLRLDSASTRYSYDFFNGGISFDPDARYTNELLSMVQQFSHKKKLDSVIKPHIHWMQTEADEPNWLLGYKILENGATIVNETDFTNYVYLTKVANGFTYVSGNIVQITTFGDVATVGLGTSAMVHWVLWRDSTNASGEFAGADPVATSQTMFEFDVHYQIDTMGSRQEFIK